jgi:TatD DNase family protein
MIDSHTHLDACEPSDLDLIGAAESAGVTRILTVGTDEASCRAALAAAESFANVWAAIGCHPHHAESLDAEFLHELGSHRRCAAIGETGLDYHRNRAPHDAQQRAFEAQIDLAHALGKPLVIHCRDAADDTLALLERRAGGLEVILHCFSMPEHLDRCVAAGWWISFAGNVTYPSAGALRAAAIRVPADRLLVETDAPYLAPQVHRGQRNQPAYVVHTAAALALERRVPYAELEAAIEASAAAVFRW